MIITALFPIVCGAVLASVHLKTDRLRLILSEAATIITSLLIVRLICAGMEKQTLMSYGSSLDLTFGLDSTGRAFLALLAFLWPLAILYTNEYMEHEERPDSFTGFYIMTYGIMVLLCCAQSLMAMYISYELLTVVTLPLVWHKKDRESIHAARDYVRYSIGAAALGFIAMIMISYFGGGSFSYASQSLASMPTASRQLAYLFCFFGFGVKATVFPLCAWLPRACAAPTPVTALLHAVAVVNAGVFCVLRATYYVFDPAMILGTTAQVIALIAAICTILFGAIMAVKIRHVKRKLAYSTISNLGYMLFGIALMTDAGMLAALTHMISHSLMKITLFFCIGAIMCKTDRTQMSEMHGMAHVMPKIFTVFVIASIALMGIPPFSGFISKYRLITAAVEEGTVLSYLGSGALIISAILTAVYTLSVLIPAYTLPLTDPEKLPAEKCDPGWRMMLPLMILVIAFTVFGCYSQPVYNALKVVADAAKGAL